MKESKNRGSILKKVFGVLIAVVMTIGVFGGLAVSAQIPQGSVYRVEFGCDVFGRITLEIPNFIGMVEGFYVPGITPIVEDRFGQQPISVHLLEYNINDDAFQPLAVRLSITPNSVSQAYFQATNIETVARWQGHWRGQDLIYGRFITDTWFGESSLDTGFNLQELIVANTHVDNIWWPQEGDWWWNFMVWPLVLTPSMVDEFLATGLVRHFVLFEDADGVVTGSTEIQLAVPGLRELILATRTFYGVVNTAFMPTRTGYNLWSAAEAGLEPLTGRTVYLGQVVLITEVGRGFSPWYRISVRHYGEWVDYGWIWSHWIDHLD